MGPVSRGGSTSTKQIQLLWSALTTNVQTGDAPIRSYNLEWDTDGTQNQFVELVGQTLPFMNLTYTVTGSITPGMTYNFRIRALNKWGFGPYSVIVPIQASTASVQMAPPQVNYYGTQIRISWVAPYNNGATITRYLIEILQNPNDGSSFF